MFPNFPEALTFQIFQCFYYFSSSQDENAVKFKILSTIIHPFNRIVIVIITVIVFIVIIIVIIIVNIFISYHRL